ncbi:MAG: DNA translocase FtsK [Clostridia bacterium]|nr:DNA translocase FtsK [Clostridia bacterium]
MAKKKQTKKSQKQSKQKTKREVNIEVYAVILFFVSLFILLVSIIPGGNFWNSMHKFFLGIGGYPIYLWTIFGCVVGGLISFGKAGGKNTARLIEGGVAIYFLQILTETIKYTDTLTFGKYITTAYTNGITGGGFFGAILGYPLAAWLGKAGAIITLSLLLSALLIIATGIPLYKVLKTTSKPAVKVAEKSKEIIEERKRLIEEARLGSGSVDIPLDGDETPKSRKKNKEETIDDKRKRLINTYNGENPDDDNNPDADIEVSEEEQRSKDIDEIIKSLNGENDEVVEEEDIVEDEPIEEPKKKTSKPLPDMVEVVNDQPEEYRYPPVTLLNKNKSGSDVDINEELRQNAAHLVDTLKSFGVETRVINISRGPTVTRYELQPAAGVRINKITALTDDIALNLATAGVRIEAPIPNKSAVGIEVPNKSSASVLLRDVVDSEKFANSDSKLTVAVGKDIAGNIITADLAKMPHILIAGTTGSGKSVCINTFLTSILFNASPEDVKMMLIDPKVVELEVYNGLPHLLVPVVTQPRKAAGALGWAVTEMERRYKLFGECRVRDLQAYNEFARANENFHKMPQILIVVDELNDLMMVAPSEVEDSICRLAQKARAAGMHLVVATQRPSVDVLTGLIKANIPSRISFKVANRFDSNTILDTQGAEKLLGKGDMLFYPVGLSKPVRVQGCWVSDEEIKNVINYITKDIDEDKNIYSTEIEAAIEQHAVETKGSKKNDDEDGFVDGDELLDDAIEAILDAGVASTSHLQRRLRVGHARAGRIMDILENKGIVGPYQGSKPREIMITRQQWMEMKSNIAD